MNFINNCIASAQQVDASFSTDVINAELTFLDDPVEIKLEDYLTISVAPTYCPINSKTFS